MNALLMYESFNVWWKLYRNLTEEVVVAVPTDQGIEKKQATDEGANADGGKQGAAVGVGGKHKIRKLKKSTKAATKIPDHAPVCRVRPTVESSIVTSASDSAGTLKSSYYHLRKTFYSEDKVAYILWQQIENRMLLLQNLQTLLPFNLPLLIVVK
jgi:hypothetical protein